MSNKRKNRGPRLFDLLDLPFLKRRRELVEPRPWPKDAGTVEVLVFKTVQFKNKSGKIVSFNKGKKIRFSRMIWPNEYTFYGLGRGILQSELERLVASGHLMVMEPK